MKRDRTGDAVLAALGIPLVIYLALLIAPALTGERVQLLMGLMDAMENPASITLVDGSLKVVVIALFAYALGIGIYYSTRRNWRRREEHGSAAWGEAARITKRYRDRKPASNKIFTSHFRLGFNVHRHKRNLNAIIVGGSGAGKTRSFAKPNVLQANSSLVVLDPKGVRPDRM